MKKITFLFLLMSSFSVWAEPQHGTVFVKPGATGTGASWTDALGNIQAAINLAKSNSATRKDVWVASGEFTITTPISLIDSVNVYGGFVGTETTRTDRVKVANGKAWEFVNTTVLKGSGTRLMQVTGNFDMETVVDGFTMTQGNGAGSTLNNSGGAVVVRGKLVYQNCILRNNAVTGSGGAATMTGGTIRYCLIENNTQTSSANGGGGIYSNPVVGTPSYIENCIIRGNISSIRGAGLGVQGSEMTYVKNTLIYNNQAIDGVTLKGGAGIYANSAKNEISNCLIFNNTGSSVVYYNGGAFLNNTVVKNVGGIYLASNAISMINNIVWGCYTDINGTSATSISGGANASATVHNNATYNGLPTDKSWSIENNILFSSNATNGDVETPQAGTVGSGPKFAMVHAFIGATAIDEEKAILEELNLALLSSSPCKDAGKTITEVTTDMLGVARPQEAAYDMGAYEYSVPSAIVNPTNNNKILVTISKSGLVSNVQGLLQVYSFSGKQLKSIAVNKGQELSLPTGAYIIRIKTNEATFAQKVIL